MRKFGLALLSIALMGFPISEGSATGMLILGAPASGGGVNFTPTANPALQAGTANPQVFTGLSIGTAAANRYVIVCLSEVGGSGAAVAVTVGGVSATLAVANSNSSQDAELWYANVTSGTTATVSITLTTAYPTEVGVQLATINTATPTPNTTTTAAFNRFANDPQTTSGTLTVNANGIGVVCAGAQTPGTTTWNVGTQDYTVNVATTWQQMLGHIPSTGSQTPSISGLPFSSFGIAAASWGP